MIVRLLAAALGLLALAPATAQTSRMGHAPDRPGPGFDLIDFDVEIEPDFQAGSVKGVETITFRSLEDGLDAVRLTANALALSAADSTIASITRVGEEWVFRLRRPLRKGETARLRTGFAGKPMRGFTVTPALIHTGYFACDWMVCAQDRPGDKATISLSILLPQDMRSLGPGEPLAARRRRGKTVHRWRLDRPYSSYLYAFAAGRLDAIALPPAGKVALEALTDSAPAPDAAKALAPTAAMLRFFEDKAGVPFPRRHYAQLVVSGGAAQEAVSHSTLGWEGLSLILADPREDWLIAHELAHQYWGNLVTCARWEDFWLNEGLTTFMVAAWKEQRWGRAAYDREMDLARRRVAKAAEAGFDVPLTYGRPYPGLSIRRAITYSKGALFLDALRAEMGDTRFWNGLRAYTRAFAGGSADSRDFQAAMEGGAPGSLAPIFATWVFGEP